MKPQKGKIKRLGRGGNEKFFKRVFSMEKRLEKMEKLNRARQ